MGDLRGRLYLLLILLCIFTPAVLSSQDVLILGSIPLDREIDATALSPNTGTTYSINSNEKSLYIFDLGNYSLKKVVRLERKPNAIAVNPLDNTAFITARWSANKGVLYIVDSVGNVIKMHPLPGDPQGIVIDPERDSALIAIEQDKQLLSVSLNTFNTTRAIPLPHRPRNIALDTDSNRAIIIAGEAEGEGKQNQVLIVDLNTGSVLNNIRLTKEINSLAVDEEKDIAVLVSVKEVTLLDVNTGNIISTIDIDDARDAAINQPLHKAVITYKEGFILLDLETMSTTRYLLDPTAKAVAVDVFRNTALIGTDNRLIEIQLPNPIPQITNLIPKSSRLGEGGFNLIVEGKGFITTSTVRFNGNDVKTTFKDNRELEAEIPSSLISEVGTVPVTVVNPSPDGGISEPYLFIIKYPIPVIASISPSTIFARNPDFILKVLGQNFMPGYIVNFNGQDLSTTYINSGELKAVVPASLIATKGSYLVVVISPDRQNSNIVNFTVLDPAPQITGFTPKEGQTGTLVTIIGANFNYQPVRVHFNGIQAVIQTMTAGEIKVVVPAGATTGTISVETPLGRAVTDASFTVLQNQDFELSVSPQSVSVSSGGKASLVISLKNTGTTMFSGLVKLKVNNIPEGITASFSREYISVNQASILTVGLSSTTLPQIILDVEGTADVNNANITRMVSVTLIPIPSGVTTISGQVLTSKDAIPIKGVTLQIGDKTAVTDGGGNFFFRDVSVGEQVLRIDGHTANTVYATYPSAISVPVTIISGVDNKLPYFIYLHEVNTKHFTPIDPTKDTIVKDPEILDYEMLIPAGVVIIGWDGLPNERVSVTVVPLDRLPVRPPPEDVYVSEVYMYYFDKPGGGTPTKPIPVKMPNTFNGEPGDRVTLWYYDESPDPDPDSNQWKPFGMGTVSEDGRNIIPDEGVGIPKFCCGASYVSRIPPVNPPPMPQDSNICSKGQLGVGDPVDPYTGAFTYSEDDIGYPSSMINIKRLYNSKNGIPGLFGTGTGTNYNHFLQGSSRDLTLRYTPPEGGIYILLKQEDGIFKNDRYPFLKGAKAYHNGDGTRTLMMADKSSYTFDSSGRLIEQKDKNGNWVKILRKLDGYIASIIDNFGRSLNFSSTTMFGILVSSIKDMSGREIKYTYDNNAKLTSVTFPDGSKKFYTYKVQGRLVSITNSDGVVEVTNEYDSWGRVSKQIQANGGEYLFYYFSPSTPVRVQAPLNPHSGTCSPLFVREGESAPSGDCGVIYVNIPSNMSVPQGSTAILTVTQTVVINPNKSFTTYRFNGQGYPISVIDGIGRQTNYERQVGTNLLLSETDVLGRKTSYTYDANGNRTSVTDPAGNTTRYEYELMFNKPIKITDALGNITLMSYDSKGNLISVNDPMGNTTAIAYNQQGQPVSITDAFGNKTSSEYDAFGNLIKAVDPLGNTARMEYDLIGRLIRTIDAKGKETSYSYDAMDRITEVIDVLSGRTRFTYDLNGNFTSVTDAKNQTIHYTYNVRNKVSSMTDQLGKVETYGYDLNDNLIKTTDRKGQVTRYTYDMFDRMTRVDYADGSYTTYNYDVMGKLTYIYDSISGAMEYEYSNTGCSTCGGSLDKVIREITPLGAVSYTYDALGRKTSMTVAGQETVYYNYDANGRLTEIRQGTRVFTISYNALGRRTSLTRPNGVTTNYAYDNASQLLSLEHLNPLNEILEKINYVYDVNSNRTMMERLNIPVKLPNPMQATYDQANRITAHNSEILIHDENGNLIQKGDTVYEWNVRNQLVAIDSPTYKASFKYDALGRRVEKTINGKTTQYLYDGLDIIQEIEDGMVSANYIRTLNIDEPLVRIKSNGTVRYYQQDALGSVVALTDENGAIKTQYTYDPFGNATVSGEPSDNPYQFVSKENDGTGLMREGYRYYSFELQRYISEDPIGLLGGDVNLYVRVGNNPINFVDPLGLIGLISRESVPKSAIANVELIVSTITYHAFTNQELRMLEDLIIPEVSLPQVYRFKKLSLDPDRRLGITEKQLEDVVDIFEKLLKKNKNNKDNIDLVLKAIEEFGRAYERGLLYIKRCK